jgi:hypothetical protein
MKKYLPFILSFVLVLSLAVAGTVYAQACDPADPGCIVEPAPTPTNFVLPSYLELLLASGVAYLVTQGYKAFGLPISGASSQVVAGLTTGLVTFINSLLLLVPPDQQPLVGAIFMAVAGILAAAGIHYTVKNKGQTKPAVTGTAKNFTTNK